MTREKLVAAALLVSTFMAGALSALAVDRTLNAPRPEQTAVRGPGIRGAAPAARRGPEGRAARGGPLSIAPMLEQRLGLSEGQRADIEDILVQHREGTDSLLRSMRPRLESQVESARAAIRAVLDEEQRAEFERFMDEGRRMMMRRTGRAPGEMGTGLPQ
jgi:hypothetical protein